MPWFCRVCQTHYSDNISEVRHRMMHAGAGPVSTKRPHSPEAPPPAKQMRPVTPVGMMNMGFDGGATPTYIPGYDTPRNSPAPVDTMNMEWGAGQSSVLSTAEAYGTPAPDSRPPDGDDWDRFGIPAPSSTPFDLWHIQPLFPAPVPSSQAVRPAATTVLGISQRIRTPGDWDSQHDDIVPWLLVRLPAWPRDIAIVIWPVLHMFIAPGSSRILRRVTLIRNNDHYNLQGQGNNVLQMPADGDCFYHAVLQGLSLIQARLPGVSPAGDTPGTTRIRQLRGLLAQCAQQNARVLAPFLRTKGGQRPSPPPEQPGTASGYAGFAVPSLPGLESCPYGCGFSTPYSSNLNRHEKTCRRRPPDAPEVIKLPCQYGCGYSTPHPGNLKTHEKTCWGRPPGTTERD